MQNWSAHTQRSREAGRGTQILNSEDRKPCPGPCQDCPGGPTVPWSRCDAHPGESVSMGVALWSTFQTEGCHCLGIRDTCRRRAFQGHTRLIMGCLGEEPKPGKGVNLGDFRRNKHGKIKGYGYKKGQLHVSDD